MKKVMSLILATALCLSMVACTPQPKAEEKPAAETATAQPAAKEANPAADVAAQGYDFYDGAMTYDQAVKKLGPIPKITKPLQLGYVCKAFENEFWRMQKEGAEAAAKSINDQGFNVKFDVRAAQGEADEQGQLAVFSDMINKGYDGILVSAISEGNLVPGAEKANAKGVEMVTSMDAFMPQVGCTVGAWHYQAGQMSAEWINKAIGGEGEVAVLQGLPNSTPAKTRTEGFKKWFEKNNPKVKVVAVQNADWDRMKAKDVTDTWIKQYPNLKAIYANNDTMAMGALEALRPANKLGKCLVVGTDGTSEAKESIKKGELSATINSFPYYMAQISTEMLIRKMGGQEVPKVIYAPQVAMDKTNINTDDAKILESVGWKGLVFAK